MQIRIAPKVIHDGKVNNINNDGEEREKEANDLKPYATLEDLERGKLPPEEILSLPMFKVLYHVIFQCLSMKLMHVACSLVH